MGAEHSTSSEIPSTSDRKEPTMSRRAVLAAALGLVGSFLPVNHTDTSEVESAPASIETYLYPPRSKENAAELAVSIAEALERIRPEAPQIKSPEEAVDFQNEFVPYLAKIGYLHENALVYPEIVVEDFGDTGGMLSQYYTFGRTQCQQIGAIYSQPAVIKINSGFFDDSSRLGTSEKNALLVATVAHEDCHANELSCEASEYVEAVAQLASTNALFAMTLEGSRLSFPAALYQMQDIARSYYLTELIKEGDIDEYYDFLARLPRAEREIEEWDFIQTFWQDDPEKFDAFVRGITLYGRIPYEVLSDALAGKDQTTTGFPRPYSHLAMSHTREVLAHLPAIVDKYINSGPRNS